MSIPGRGPPREFGDAAEFSLGANLCWRTLNPKLLGLAPLMRQHRFFARKAKLVLANLFFRPGQGSKGQAGSRGVEGFQGGPRVEGQGSRGPGGLLWTYMFDHKLGRGWQN